MSSNMTKIGEHRGRAGPPGHKGASPWTKEGRRKAFLRLANKRVPRLLHDFKLVGNLALYPHDEIHARKILEVVEDAKEKLTRRFEGKGNGEDGFKL